MVKCAGMSSFDFFEKCSLRYVNDEKSLKTKRPFLKTFFFEKNGIKLWSFLKEKNKTIIFKNGTTIFLEWKQ